MLLTRARLLITMFAPTLLVAFGLHVLHDVRWAFLLYVFGSCAIVPALVLGIRPFSSRDGLPLRAESERLFGWFDLPFAFLLFGPVFLLAYGLIRNALTAPEPYLDALQAYGWSADHTVLYLVLFALFVPLFEEWWWRGQFLPRAERAFGRGHAWWITALGFALYHIVVLLVLYEPALALLRFSGIVSAGVAWTLIARSRRSWGWVYVAHLAADATLVTAFLLWVRPAA